MLPKLTPENFEAIMQKLTGYQRRVVKGRMMAELRCSWSLIHDKITNGFSEDEQKKVLSILSDYVIVTKEAA